MDLAMEMTPAEVKRRLDAGETLQLMDCREPEEFETASISGTILIPMNTVPQQLQRIEALADAGPVIVICHHGVRSLMVVNWLRQRGVEGCCSMSGGIDEWSLSIDRDVPRY